MKGKKVVIYARQSSGSDDQSESIDFQIQQCQELATSSRLEVIGVYADYNTSGRLYPTGAEAVAVQDKALLNWKRERTFEKQYRSGLGDALARLPLADYLLVYDTTRLCRPVRNSFLQQYIDNILIEANVSLMTVKDGCSNPSSFTDSLVNTIKSHVNDNQTQLTAEKSRKAMVRLRDSGIIPTAPKMFGIRYLGGKGKTVEAIPECVPVIKFVFEQIILMRPYNQIIREMNSRFKAAAAGKAFYDSSLRHIVAQPFYCGMMYDSAGELIPARQMQGKEIVSYETWKKANEIMARNRTEPQRRKKNPHPFTHLLRCGYCGAKMVGGVDGGKEYYHCHRGANLLRNEDCAKARITLNLVRRSAEFTGFKEAVAPVLALAMFNELQENEISDAKRRELAQLESRHQRMLAQKDEIRDRYAEGRIEFDSFEYISSKLKRDDAEIVARIQKLKGSYTAREMARRAKEYLDRIQDVMADRLEPHVFENLLRQSVKSIFCFENRVEIDTVYGKITLRRYMAGKSRNFPRFTYRIMPRDGSRKVVDLRQAKIEVTYIYAQSEERRVLVDFSVMRILEQI